MGLARLFHRDVKYAVTDTDSGQSQTFTIVDGLAPDWSTGDYRGAMGVPGAWRGANLLADLLGSVPWHAYRERAGRPAERIDPTPPLLARPAPPDVRVTTFSSWGLDLIWHGNALGLIAGRNREGWPVSVLPVPAEQVHVKRVEEFDGVSLPVGSIAYRVGTRTYAAEDVVHVKGPCKPGALRGMGVLENHLNTTLGLASEQARQARTLGTSGIPTGILHVEEGDEEFTQADADDVKAKWLAAQRDRTIAVLNESTKFEPIAWNPSETQLLEARKFSLHEVALILGLDPSWLGVAGSSRTYKNEESVGLNLIKFSLNGHLARFEQTLSSHMPRGTWAEANLDSVLRADTLTRFQAYAIGIDKGFLLDDEVRELERRAPLTPAQRAARAPTPAPRPAAPSDDEMEKTDA